MAVPRRDTRERTMVLWFTRREKVEGQFPVKFLRFGNGPRSFGLGVSKRIVVFSFSTHVCLGNIYALQSLVNFVLSCVFETN